MNPTEAEDPRYDAPLQEAVQVDDLDKAHKRRLEVAFSFSKENDDPIFSYKRAQQSNKSVSQQGSQTQAKIQKTRQTALQKSPMTQKKAKGWSGTVFCGF